MAERKQDEPDDSPQEEVALGETVQDERAEEGSEAAEVEAERESDPEPTQRESVEVAPQGVDVEAAEDESAGPGVSLDLPELGRRYAVASGFSDGIRAGFRELKRHPGDAKRLAALLRGLARKHDSEAQVAAEQIERLIEKIQRREES